MQLIIPTLWKPPGVVAVLHHYLEAEAVERLILIDNAPDQRPAGVPSAMASKLLLLPQASNIFVNPAWNLGIEQVRDPKAIVLILNDDILLPQAVLNQLARHPWQPGDVLGLLPAASTAASAFRLERLAYDRQRSIGQQQPGFGSALVMQRETYRTIPEDLQIWFGDDWLLRSATRVFGFWDPAIERQHHLSMGPMRQDQAFRERLAADRAAARCLLGLA